jgi:hypothetical protein
MILEILFGAVYMCVTTVAVWSLSQLRAFIAETPRIGDEAALVRYRGLVRVQMYIALGGIVVLLAGVVFGMLLIRKYGLWGFVVVLLTNLEVLALGLYHKRWENRVRSLPAADSVAFEYAQISETWLKKPLPDF